MHRHCLAIALLSTLLTPALALGQVSTGEITVKYDGEQVENANNILRIGGPDCEDNTLIRFEILPVGTGGTTGLRDQILQVWTAGTGTDCSDPSNRQSGTQCSQTACTYVTERGQMQSNFYVEARAQELFGNAEGDCPTTSTRRVSLVAVDSTYPMCGNADMDTAGGAYFVDFTIQARDAATVSNVRARDGDSSFSVSWQRADGSLTTDSYLVVSQPVEDVAGGGDAGSDDCPAIFTEGGPPSQADIDGLVNATTTKSESTSANLSTNNVEYGERVAVTVLTEDLFGNRSVASETSCATRIRTDGLVGAYESESGKTVQTCSSGSAPSGGSGTWLWALGGLLLTARVLRRTGRTA